MNKQIVAMEVKIIDTEKLRELRIKSGISQSDMAKALNISRQAYNHYEIGSREPNHETMSTIANILGCTIDYLLGRSNKNSSQKESLSPKEKRLIERIQTLNEDELDQATDFIEFILAKHSPIKIPGRSDRAEIAAFGADETQGTYIPPTEETT